MYIDYKLIGKRIQSQRKKLQKTQEWLAEQLSVTVGYISQIERGITKVSLDTLAQISTILQMDISYFLTGTIYNEQIYLEEEFYEKLRKLSCSKRKVLYGIMDVLLETEI